MAGPTLLKATEWAEAEYTEADLGDKRRTNRLIRVAGSIAENPMGTLPGSFDSWKELKAAYRLLNEKEVTCEKVIGPHCKRVKQACQGSVEKLIIEDTTELDFSSHGGTTGLGETGVGFGRGLHLHSSLVLDVKGWKGDEPEVMVDGLLGQKCWAREGGHRRQWESERERLSRPRESERWGALFEETGGPGEGGRWTYIADRESDIYELFARCEQNDIDYIVRASHPRALADGTGSVHDAVSRAAQRGTYQVEIRARGNQKARVAEMEVRAAKVTIRGPWRPGGWTPARGMNVVEAREVHTPEGVEPIHWVLLTSWPVETRSQAYRVIKAYEKRWLVEEYFKALKSGAKVQDSQLKTAKGIKALLGILAVVAVRLLNLKLLGRAGGDEPASEDEFGPEARAILAAKVGKPKEGWTYRTLLVAIAKLGGFPGRKCDGEPGWITIWRGWGKLMWMVHGIEVWEEIQRGSAGVLE